MGKENNKKGVELLKEKIQNISHKPGVYRMLSESGTVLYVGKAKNLQKRLTNYIHFNKLSNRIRQMVNQTADLVIVETAGETDAFLLENDLIKQFKPYYNILLKDDKSYPYIVITTEETPRLLKYRGARTLKGAYFGPFTSSLAIKQSLTELQKIFGLRTCNNTFFRNRTRPCLLYQIKRCTGPCCTLISKEKYQEKVSQAKAFMRGEKTNIQEELQKEMKLYSNQMDYEKAATLRDKIIALNHIQDTDSKSPLKNTDIIAIHTKNGQVCIQIFFYRTGQAEGNISHFLQEIDESLLSETISSFLMQFYDKIPAPYQIYISYPIEAGLAKALAQKVKHSVNISSGPFKGTRKKLMNQALKNAEQSYQNTVNEHGIQKTVWEELRQLLNIPILEKIEIYDNSHIQGTAAIGAMVCATINGFQKKDYRRFNINAMKIKTNDDFGMMREVMRRRLTRGLIEKNLPTAILIDGGKGQLSSVIQIMNEMNIHNISLLAVAKGEKRNAGKETLFLGSNPHEPIHLNLKSGLIHLIQRLRDEAHRFAISSHRQKRAKNMFHETLLDIEGIGEKRKKELLQHFGSPKAISGASLNQIMRVPGINEKIAKKVYTFYHD